MNSLVDYGSSDEDSVDQDEYVPKQTDLPKYEQEHPVTKESSLKNKDILQKCLNLRKKYSMKTEFFDENYYMKLESELGSESVQDTNFVKSEKPIIKSQCNSNFNIPQPKFVSEVTPIDLNTEFLDIVDDDDDTLPNPRTFNLNLIKEQKTSEIPATCLVSSRLLTIGEQAGIKRKQNIDIGTVSAKSICMDDLTADRPIDMKPGLSAEELSKFRSIRDEEPDKNSSRQHQITWLAHKAKEREFELMNRWSENSFSQKESRSKYGF